MTHFSVEEGKDVTIAKAIYKALKNIDPHNSLSIIGLDRNAIKTGKHHGSIATLEELLKILLVLQNFDIALKKAILEELLQRLLQRIICLLRTNKLPLRHVFKHLNGGSLSPNSSSGPIGKELYGLVSYRQVVRPLSPIDFPQLPIKIVENLNFDQFYAYQICWVVISGTLDNDSAQFEVGGLSNARWLALACRMLHLPNAPLQDFENFG